MNFFDTPAQREGLLPFTFTRPVSECRIGILTGSEKWKRWLNADRYGHLTVPYLSVLFPAITSEWYLNGGVLPEENLANVIRELPLESCLWHQGVPLAFRTAKDAPTLEQLTDFCKGLKAIPFSGTPDILTAPWHFFQKNGKAIQSDFDLICRGRTSAPLHPSNTVIGDPSLVFLEAGASILASTINTTSGPVYLDKDAEIMEGCSIRGPLALGEHAALKMAAKVYGPTTLGPHCKAGGELNNVVFFGYSNKAHDGFLGNSVIGEWCNLGADTNNSNLKNNYATVDVYDYPSGKSQDTGLQFCGLMMGDHSKSGINTMFNTGTVVGVSANIFGSGFPPKFIPSFTWGGAEWLRTFVFEKSLEVAARMMERRGLPLTTETIEMLRAVYELEEANRKKIKG